MTEVEKLKKLLEIANDVDRDANGHEYCPADEIIGNLTKVVLGLVEHVIAKAEAEAASKSTPPCDGSGLAPEPL